MKKFNIPYGKQQITREDADAVLETLYSDFLTQGPKVEEFERNFASYTGSKFAVAVANGTAALHLACLSLGVNEQSNVITTPITFVASANAVKFCGGNVYLSDIDADTGLLDLNKLESLLKSKGKGFFQGVIPVDFAGGTVNTEELRALADKYGFWILEDACHAIGGFFYDSYSKKQICGSGTFSDLTVFSFHPVKHIACGEGGMITTNDESLYSKLKLLRTHGITKSAHELEENHGGWYYEMQELGYNYRLTDIQAALGVSQMKRIDENLNQRRKIASRYNEAFKNTDIQPLLQKEGHAYHLYVIKIEDRKGLYEHLRKQDIFSQVHYIPVHYQPYYKKLGFKVGDFPEAERYYEQCLSLPMYHSLTDEEQDYVIREVLNYVSK